MSHCALLYRIRMRIVVFVRLAHRSDQCHMVWQIRLVKMNISQPWTLLLKDFAATRMNTCLACSMVRRLRKAVAESRGISMTISKIGLCRSWIDYDFRKLQRMRFEER